MRGPCSAPKTKEWAAVSMRICSACKRRSAGCKNRTLAQEGEMKWVTREKVKVDRVACPWLIRKFIDQQAEFLFVPADQVMEVAKREGATPYDVEGVEFGHHGKECSFDAFVQKHHLDRDPAIVLMAK